MFPDTSVRTDEEEEMDDFSLAGESFGQVLDNIASINRWLGGNTATISALNKLITEQAFDELKIIDAGCGGGDMCREIAKWGRKVGQKTSIIGIDANAYALKHAAKKSTDSACVTAIVSLVTHLQTLYLMFAWLNGELAQLRRGCALIALQKITFCMLGNIAMILRAFC